jgi:hypothetical protein
VLPIVDDRHAADVEIPHQSRGGVEPVVGPARGNVPAHQIFDHHELLLIVGGPSDCSGRAESSIPVAM